MIQNLSNFALFLVALAGIILTGRVILSYTKLRLTPGERLVWSFALGSFTISITLTALGFAGFFTRYAGYVVLTLSLTAVFFRPKKLAAEVNNLYESLRRFIKKANTWELRVPLLVLILLSLYFLIIALAPEYRYDSLFYHLELPKRYIEAGRITYEHDIIQSAFPAAWDILYGYGLLIATETVSKLLAFTAGVCTLVAVYSAGRRLFGGRAGVFAVLIIAVTPFFAEYWSNAMADIPFALFLTLGALTLVYGRKHIYRAAIIAGILLGFATASRLQGLILAPVIFVVYVAVIASTGRGLKRTLSALVIVFGVAIIITVPWYVRNLLATGSIIGYVGTDVSRFEEWRTGSIADSFLSSIRQYFEAESFRGPGGPWYTKLLIPFRLTFSPGMWGQGTLGPLYLAFLPGVFFVRKHRRRLWLFVGIIGLALLAWVVLLKETNVRYLIPAALPAAIAIGCVLPKFFENGRIGKGAVWVLVLFAAASSIFFVRYYSELLPYGFGFKGRNELVVKWAFHGFDAINAVNSLPEGSVVYSDEGRTFYFDKPVVIGRPEHNPYFNTTEIESPGEMLTWFAEHNITHALAASYESDFTFPEKPYGNPDGKYNFRKDFLDVYGTVLAEGGAKAYRSGYYTLYEIHYP
jgi:hypothetical protein